LAWWAPSASWFYPVFILAGIANVATWTIGLAMLQEFGEENDRPAYIGMANTFVAPFSILAPFIGGWLADAYGYPSAFLASAVFGLITTIVLIGLVDNPTRALQGSHSTSGDMNS
jgi:MFS family permease